MTNDSQPHLYNLSRRKILAGLGAVGLASAGAGLGTAALFSDEESLTDNTIAAGTLDLSVDSTLVAASSFYAGDVGTVTTADGAGASIGFQVTDFKPGDWLIYCFDITSATNAAYVNVSTANFGSFENSVNDPEEGDADEDNTEAQVAGTDYDVDPDGLDKDGELEDALLATIWGSWTSGGSSDDRFGLAGLDDTTDNDATANTPDQYDTPDLDGVVSGTGMHYTTIDEAHATYSTGVDLRDGSGNLIEVADSPATSFYLLLELPAGVGNEVQSDSIEFDLVFTAEQVRNNPTPFDGDPNA